MDLTEIQTNAAIIAREMEWLELVINIRMNLYLSLPGPYQDIAEATAPDLSADHSMYARVVKHYKINLNERLILLLALAPHIRPHLLDVFFVKNQNYDRGYTEFGGIKGQNHGGFIPTGETAAFILAPNNMSFRFQLINIFGEDHFFRKFSILKLVHPQSSEPFLSGALTISPEYLNYFTLGKSSKPDYNINFPAKLVQTSMDWDDLILDDTTLEEVLEIRDWIDYGDTLLNDWEMRKMIKPGFKALFYGPPGTGKTLTACLLGKSAGMDVYRIDLSMVVSKYIGETEKNLSNVFDQAENKNWILFFDEADALFGKRTQTSSANDRYANQEVSYLLQRIEDFPGVAILATNIKANLDEAFSRRFQSMVHFTMPGPEQRMRLWKQSFSGKAAFEDKLSWEEIARKHEMAGGAIINVSRYSSIKALKRGNNVILQKDILAGIRREFSKEGKTV